MKRKSPKNVNMVDVRDKEQPLSLLVGWLQYCDRHGVRDDVEIAKNVCSGVAACLRRWSPTGKTMRIAGGDRLYYRIQDATVALDRVVDDSGCVVARMRELLVTARRCGLGTPVAVAMFLDRTMAQFIGKMSVPFELGCAGNDGSMVGYAL